VLVTAKVEKERWVCMSKSDEERIEGKKKTPLRTPAYG